MFKQTRTLAVLRLLGIAGFLSAALIGCVQPASPTALLATSSATALPTQTSIATAPPSTPGDQMILSIDENGYAHLFLFSPATSTYVRITSGQFSDITPALS